MPVSSTQSRWNASGQLSQHSSRPVSLHTAHVSSLWSSAADSTALLDTYAAADGIGWDESECDVAVAVAVAVGRLVVLRRLRCCGCSSLCFCSRARVLSPGMKRCEQPLQVLYAMATRSPQFGHSFRGMAAGGRGDRGEKASDVWRSLADRRSWSTGGGLASERGMRC